ncbi:MAG: glutathione S-transferase family protein [Archangium sp.]
MRLYFAPGCPYAQRTRALLSALNENFEPVEIDLANKPADFLAKSPTGAVPMLEDGTFVLFESAVVNEYLAEKFAWKDAYPADVKKRAQERLAMRRFDDVFVSLFFRALKDESVVAANQNFKKELAYFAEVVREAKPKSLLGFHVATHWVRMKWVKPSSPVVVAMQEACGEFLDAAAALPEVVHTNPDRESTVKAILSKFG